MPDQNLPDELQDDAAKYGARNSSSDKQRIREIRKAARQIDSLSLELEPKDEDLTPEEAILGKARGLTAEGVDMLPCDAVKAAGDWELDVLGVPYGGPNAGRDSDGEYFSADTQTYSDIFPSPPAVYYHGYSPEGKPMGEPAIIGKVTKIWRDAKGWWYRVVLDRTKDLAGRIWQSAKEGKARASSGSIAHMVRKQRDGHITHWPVAELSLIDADGKRQPANQYAVAMLAAKALYEQSGEAWPDVPEAADAAGNGEAGPVEQSITTTQEGIEMEIDIKTITEQIKAELQAEAEAKAAKQAEIDAAIKAEREKWEKEQAEGRRLPTKQALAELKFDRAFDNLDVADHAFLIGVMDAKKTSGAGRGPSEAALKSYAAKVEAEASKDKAAEFAAYEMKAAGLKSNELDYSTYSNYGDDWVGIAYSTALWESIRVGTSVVNNLPTIEVPRGMESMIIPLEYTDPTFYKVAEATSHDSTMLFPVATVTSSKIGTNKATLSLSKLGARVPWSGELEERSLIPWIGQVRQQLQVSGAEYLESAIIDGDTATTTTTNINDIASTADQGGTEHYLLFNGFRKSPLVTTAANSRSAGGSLDVLDYLATVKLMGGAGINGLDRSKVAFIVDPNTHWKTLELPEVLTKDVYNGATVEGGIVTRLWGYPIIVSNSMHKMSAVRLANSAGKVDQDVTGNNLYGSILAVRWDQWRFGWQRRATIEVTRYPRSDSSEIVMLMTCGLIQRDTEASAITYYVGV